MDTNKRVNVAEFKAMMRSLPKAELSKQNQADYERCIAEYKRFKERYNHGECPLCGKPFETISQKQPCVHWLLRRCKFKKKDFPLVFQNFDYHQIAAFLRWSANQERFQGNINDLREERSNQKLFQYTITFNNIEWTFDCSGSDYAGHQSGNCNYPHYHFQMRLDKKPFIDFSDYHIPFSEQDLFILDLVQSDPDFFHHSFGPGGAGMEEAIALTPEDIIEWSSPAPDEASATYHLQTFVTARDEPIKGEEVELLFEESRQTGKTFAQLAQKYFKDKADIQTVISPSDSIPDIAKRTERRRHET